MDDNEVMESLHKAMAALNDVLGRASDNGIEVEVTSSPMYYINRPAHRLTCSFRAVRVLR